MFFSPITERSFKVRAFYTSLYTALIAGGITMVVPFIIMISGSVEPALRATDSIFFPRYLTDREALWTRYLESKYGGVQDAYRMAMGDPKADFLQTRIPEHDLESLALWQQYWVEQPPPEILMNTGFVRNNRRMPAYNTREFRTWLMHRYDNNIDLLNQKLGSSFLRPTLIYPPYLQISGSALPKTPLIQDYLEFSASQVPAGRKFAWDAGGYYRAILLPRMFGADVSAFNETYGTHYTSFADIPFTATVPEVAADSWLFYVTKVLRPDFVELTEAGQAKLKESGVEQDEYIGLLAEPEDLRVVSVDLLFQEWAQEKHGIENARIPQLQVDLADFEQDAKFWRNVFLVINYQTVVDEVFLYGRAFFNTFVLVILSVGGALIINPLAAYALSRYKLRQTYSILLFFLATIAFPAEVTMIPVFLQLKEFNLLNTFGALVLPGLANGFSIFLLKGFFDSLPKELYEAAELDGASEWLMFWQITMNLSKPILAVIALGAFVSAYSAFFYALILAPDPRMWTIMVYIYQLRGSVDSPVVYASLILTAIPTLLVFIFCQNIILRGIVVPSDK
jgi:multiple sugar transport system permease protein